MQDKKKIPEGIFCVWVCVCVCVCVCVSERERKRERERETGIKIWKKAKGKRKIKMKEIKAEKRGNIGGKKIFRKIKESYFLRTNWISCQIFWDEAWWLRVFRLLSSSLLLFLQLFGDISSSLLQLFVELGNLDGTSNYVLYWIHAGCLFWFR